MLRVERFSSIYPVLSNKRQGIHAAGQAEGWCRDSWSITCSWQLVVPLQQVFAKIFRLEFKSVCFFVVGMGWIPARWVLVPAWDGAGSVVGVAGWVPPPPLLPLAPLPGKPSRSATPNRGLSPWRGVLETLLRKKISCTDFESKRLVIQYIGNWQEIKLLP